MPSLVGRVGDAVTRKQRASNTDGIDKIIAAVATNRRIGTILSEVVRAAAKVCAADIAGITLLTDNRDELEVACIHGSAAAARGKRLPLVGSLSGLAVTTSRPIRSLDVLADPRPFAEWVARCTSMRAMLIVPLRNQEYPLGTLMVTRKTPGTWLRTQEEALVQLADLVSIAVQSLQLRELLRRSTWSAIASDLPAKPKAVVELRAESSGANLRKHTAREREIINLLIVGQTYKEVAATIGISARTVEHYVDRLKHRHRVTTIHGLVGHFLRKGVELLSS
jgi:GAF domain-containing protein